MLMEKKETSPDKKYLEETNLIECSSRMKYLKYATLSKPRFYKRTYKMKLTTSTKWNLIKISLYIALLISVAYAAMVLYDNHCINKSLTELVNKHDLSEDSNKITFEDVKQESHGKPILIQHKKNTNLRSNKFEQSYKTIM